MRESVAVVCHGQGAIAVSDKSRTPRPQEISSLKQLFSYPEWLLMRYTLYSAALAAEGVGLTQ